MTSIEWLIKQIELDYNGENELTYTEFVEQAKEMHRKELVRVAMDHMDHEEYDTEEKRQITAERYYNNIYKSK